MQEQRSHPLGLVRRIGRTACVIARGRGFVIVCIGAFFADALGTDAVRHSAWLTALLHLRDPPTPGFRETNTA
eukprot:gene3114-3894_t